MPAPSDHRSPRYSDALGHGQSDKRIDILRGIGRSGSISQAARDVGVSYKAAWQAVATLTNLSGVPLVARAVGGAGGGGATLTEHGQQLLQLADAHAAARRALQASGSGQGGKAATSFDPGVGAGVARLALRTSMRNQLPAQVQQLERGGRIVRVHLMLPHGEAITARITQESTELLGLVEGMTALVLCKATAVHIERADAQPQRAPGNQLSGVVRSVARSSSGDEIVMGLGDALQLVGFAAAGSGLRTRQRVRAWVDEAGVVLALPG